MSILTIPNINYTNYLGKKPSSTIIITSITYCFVAGRCVAAFLCCSSVLLQFRHHNKVALFFPPHAPRTSRVVFRHLY